MEGEPHESRVPRGAALIVYLLTKRRLTAADVLVVRGGEFLLPEIGRGYALRLGDTLHSLGALSWEVVSLQLAPSYKARPPPPLSSRASHGFS